MPTVQQLTVSLKPDLDSLRAGLAQSRRSLKEVAAEAKVTERELKRSADQAAREMTRAITQAGREGAQAFRQQQASVKAAEAEWTRFARTMETESARAYGAVRREIDKTLKAQEAAARKQREALGAGVQRAAGGAMVVGAGILGGVGAIAKTAIEYQEAFAVVNKAVDGTRAQVRGLNKDLKDLSERIPVPFEQLTEIMATAAEAGVSNKGLTKITEIIAKLQATVRVGGPEVTQAFVQIANVMHVSERDFDRMGSTFTALGQNFAATEDKISRAALRLTGLGATLQIPARQILALSTAIGSLGIRPELGATAIDKIFRNINSAAISGGKELRLFAAVSRVSAADFQKAWAADKMKAFQLFIEGIDKAQKAGIDLAPVIKGLGSDGDRLFRVLTTLGGGHKVLADAIDVANESWEKNTELNERFARRTDTTHARMVLLQNRIKGTAAEIGDNLLPTIDRLITKFGELVKEFSKLSPEKQDQLLNVSLWVGGFLLIGGAVVRVTGWVLELTKALRAAGVGVAALQVLVPHEDVGLGGALAKMFPNLARGLGVQPEAGKPSAAGGDMAAAQREFEAKLAAQAEAVAARRRAGAGMEMGGEGVESIASALGIEQAAKDAAEALRNAEEDARELNETAMKGILDRRKEQEKLNEKHQQAIDFIKLENQAAKALLDTGKKGADAWAQFQEAHKGYTAADTRAMFEAEQGTKKQIKALKDAEDAAKKAAKATEDAAHNAANALIDMGRRTADAWRGVVSELGEAVTEFNRLRGVDLSGMLSPLERASSLLTGIRNATEIMNRAMEGPRQAALGALSRFAGTGGMAQEQAGLLNQAVAWLQRNAQTGQGRLPAGVAAGMAPEELRSLAESRTAEGQRRGQFEFIQSQMPQALREALERAVGDLRPFFGEIPKDAKTVFEQWATQLTTATEAFEKDAGETFVQFRSGLQGVIDHLNAQIEEFGRYLARAAQSAQFSGARAGGGSVSGGGAYLVGERGPELFVPRGSGTIVPNQGGRTVHVTMHVSTPDATSFRRSQGQVMTDLARAANYHLARTG